MYRNVNKLLKLTVQRLNDADAMEEFIKQISNTIRHKSGFLPKSLGQFFAYDFCTWNSGQKTEQFAQVKKI